MDRAPAYRTTLPFVENAGRVSAALRDAMGEAA
jgi:hypothetical protein